MRRYRVVTAKEAFAENEGIEVKSSLRNWICLRIAPELELKESVVEFIRSQMADVGEELCDRLSIALDELLGNSIEHGCQMEPKCGCELTYLRTARIIVFQIRDAGSGFALHKVAHAAVNNPPDDPMHHIEMREKLGLRPGGFGILIVKQIADDLIYNEQGNEVVLVKYLDSPAH